MAASSTSRPYAAADPSHLRPDRGIERLNYAIFAVILANAAVLGLETYDSVARDAGGLLDTLNDVFLGIFVVEFAIRLVGFGSRPQDFFKSSWNVFDFVVSCSTSTGSSAG